MSESPLNAMQANAVFQEDNGWRVADHFGDPLAEYRQATAGVVRIDLSHRTRIELVGPEAAIFLHNLCSNDTKSLKPGMGCEAFFCNHKARVIGHVHLSRLPAPEPVTIWLDAAAGQAEGLLAYLNRYLISERVELADLTSTWSQMLVAGPEARATVEGVFSVALGDITPWQFVPLTDPAGFVRQRDDLSVPAYEIWAPADKAKEIWGLLAERNVSPAGRQVFDMLRMEAGTPVMGKEMDDQRFVVETNRIAQAISYTKGCYLGQEPIVMARDRGQINRMLVGLTSADSEPMTPGSKVFQGETEIGVVTSSTFSPRLECVIALAYLKRGFWDAGTTATVFPPTEGRAATVSALPFVPPSE